MRMLWSCRSFRYRAVIAAILNFDKKTNLQGGDIVNLIIIIFLMLDASNISFRSPELLIVPKCQRSFTRQVAEIEMTSASRG